MWQLTLVPYSTGTLIIPMLCVSVITILSCKKSHNFSLMTAKLNTIWGIHEFFLDNSGIIE